MQKPDVSLVAIDGLLAISHLLYVLLFIDKFLDHYVLHACYAHSFEALAGEGTLP